MTWGGANAPPPFCYSFHPLSVSPLTDHGDSLHCFTSLRKRLCSLSKQPLSRIRGSSPYTGEPGIKACCRFPAYACSGEPGQRLRAPILPPLCKGSEPVPIGNPERPADGREEEERAARSALCGGFSTKGRKDGEVVILWLAIGICKTALRLLPPKNETRRRESAAHSLFR